MINAGKMIMPQMPNLKILRILWHDFPSSLLVAVDCRSERKISVPENRWEEEDETESNHGSEPIEGHSYKLPSRDESSSGNGQAP